MRAHLHFDRVPPRRPARRRFLLAAVSLLALPALVMPRPRRRLSLREADFYRLQR